MGIAESVTGRLDAGELNGLGKSTANGAENKGGNIALRSNGEIGSFAWKFDAAIKLKAGVFEEFGGEAHVFAAVHTPEPEFFFVALEKVEGFFELFHGAVKGGSKEEHAEFPGVAGILDVNTHTILPVLILFDAATIIISHV